VALNVRRADVSGVRITGNGFDLPLSQLVAIDPDESTAEAVGDWHYWIAQGYIP
jgi:hypothetical protein